MKIAKFILLGSLVANAALAAVYFSRSTPNTPTASSSEIATTEKTSGPAAKWVQLTKETAGNDAAFVAKLRAEGFPPEVIRAILYSRISERFAPRRRALEETTSEYAYWKGWSYPNSGNAEARTALRKLYREQSDLIRQLLGDEAVNPRTQAYNQNRYGNLSRDKIDQLNQITSDYQELMQQTQNEARGMLLPEDREKLAFLAKEQQADLAALLTPEELQAYELRSSRTAQQLKSRLTLFDATEQEYLALYRLQKTFDTQYGSSDGAGETIRTRDEQKARSSAQTQLTKDIEAALGPARYKDYQIATDYEYRRVSQLAERLSLPAATARSVIELKLDTATRVNAIRNDKTLDRQQRQDQLSALGQTVTSQLTQQLGAEGFNAYRDSGGSWFKNLAPSQPIRNETR